MTCAVRKEDPGRLIGDRDDSSALSLGWGFAEVILAPLSPKPARMDAMTASRLLVAHGARAVEDLLLARLSELAEEARHDPALLAQPVRVVVPSISLRDHLAAAIVRLTGRAWSAYR